jgi:hypothetical protein
MVEKEEAKIANLHDDADVVDNLKKELMNKHVRDDQSPDGDTQGHWDAKDTDPQGTQDEHRVPDAPGKRDTEGMQDADGLLKSIQSDFYEAKACVDAKAPNAAAMMCRRLVSRLAISNGAKDDTTTGPQLDYLKDKHLIADDLYEAARMVKALGDEGAHPPDEVTMEEARAAFKVTQAILEAMNIGGKKDRQPH